MSSSREWDGSSSDYLTVTDQSAIQDIFSGGGTASVWAFVESDGEAERGHICAKTSGDSPNNLSGWGFQVRTSDVHLGWYARYTPLGVWETSQLIPLNQWINLAVTINTSSSANDPTFYFNSIPQTTVEVLSPSGSYTSDVGDNLYIGNTLNEDRCFDGKMCYLQLWDRILSVEEIKEAMFKPGTVRQNLVAHWPILGANSPELDLSGNGNSGVVTGTSVASDGAPIRSFK